MPLYRRLPKRGFTNMNSKHIVGINVSALERFDNDTVVTVETLLESGIVMLESCLFFYVIGDCFRMSLVNVDII